MIRFLFILIISLISGLRSYEQVTIADPVADKVGCTLYNLQTDTDINELSACLSIDDTEYFFASGIQTTDIQRNTIDLDFLMKTPGFSTGIVQRLLLLHRIDLPPPYCF